MKATIFPSQELFINDVLINPCYYFYLTYKKVLPYAVSRLLGVCMMKHVCEKVEIKGKWKAQITSLFSKKQLSRLVWWQIEMIFFSFLLLIYSCLAHLQAGMCRMNCWRCYSEREILWMAVRSEPLVEYLIFSRKQQEAKISFRACFVFKHFKIYLLKSLKLNSMRFPFFFSSAAHKFSFSIALSPSRKSFLFRIKKLWEEPNFQW